MKLESVWLDDDKGLTGSAKVASRPWRGFRCVAICRCLFNLFSQSAFSEFGKRFSSVHIHATPLPNRPRSCHVENVSRTKTTPSSVCQVSRALIFLFCIYIFYIFNKGIYICMYVYRMRIVLRVATCGEATSVVRISLPKHIHRGLVGSSIV